MLSGDGYVGSCKPRSTGHELRFYEAQRKVMESLVIPCCCDSDSAKPRAAGIGKISHKVSYSLGQNPKLMRFIKLVEQTTYPASRRRVSSRIRFLFFFKIITLCCLASRRSPPCPSSCLRRSFLCRAESPRRFILAPRTRRKQ